LLRSGGLVAFPTETVYGLGANALDPNAVARIFSVKGRPSTSPLIVHVSSVEMAKSLVAEWPAGADKLTKRFWPGPLTLILPTRRGSAALSQGGKQDSPAIPLIVTAGLPTVGLRMPSHPVALSLIQAAGVPLAAPSANRFTQLSPTTAEHVRDGLGSDVDFILDAGPCQVGIESTVVSLASEPTLLRPGGISRPEIEAVIGPLALAPDPHTGAHPSPGMHSRHYSPRTKLILIPAGNVPSTGRGAFLQLQSTSLRHDMITVPMPDDPALYAAQLYETLHRLDSENYDWIAVESPPETPAWEAVLDRLRRASSA
jgi:L-threonylcarbamoyladenylate synthase